jgi:hypothetical protein
MNNARIRSIEDERLVVCLLVKVLNLYDSTLKFIKLFDCR